MAGPTFDSTLVFFDSTSVTFDGGVAVPPPPPPEPGEPVEVPALVEEQIDLVATQYRESPNLLGFARTILRQIDAAKESIRVIPDYFDLDTAVGDQLTLIGKRLGWPRCHCVCEIGPVFGFNCGPNPLALEIVGFCEGGTWINCREVGRSDICIWSDEVYRGYLLARRYQMLGLYDITSLQSAIQHIWGPTATVAESGRGRVVLAPGRILTLQEIRQLPLAIRVIPVAPGIRATLHLTPGPIFGFGEGWGGLCENAYWLCETDAHPYDCAL